MNIKRDKRGQFYLVAAVAIIVLMIGIIGVANFSKKTENTRAYELAEELKTESGKALDFGAINGVYNWDVFTKNYSDYAGNDMRIVFIVGELPSNLEVYEYNQGVKNTSIDNNLVGNNLTVVFEGIDYRFQVKQGQNFHFIIFQKIGEERYVRTSNP